MDDSIKDDFGRYDAYRGSGSEPTGVQSIVDEFLDESLVSGAVHGKGEATAGIIIVGCVLLLLPSLGHTVG